MPHAPKPPHLSPVVIVADRHAPLRRALRRLLQCLGVDILEAATGADALALLQQHQVAAIITDQNIGTGPTGLELIEEAQRRHPAIAAAFLYTGERLLHVEVWRDRFVTVIAKPAPVGLLRRALEQAVVRS